MRLSSLGCLLGEVRCFGHIQLRVGPRADPGWCRDYIAWLAWELLGVPPRWRRRMGRGRLESVCIDLDMDKWQEMDGWMVFISNNGKVCSCCWTYGELSPANWLPSAPSNSPVSFILLFSLLQFLGMGLIPSITMLGFLHLFSVKVKKNLLYSTCSSQNGKHTENRKAWYFPQQLLETKNRTEMEYWT